MLDKRVNHFLVPSNPVDQFTQSPARYFNYEPFLLIFFIFVTADTGTCEVPLGMESGMITNESLTSSSSYDQSVSPLSAR